MRERVTLHCALVSLSLLLTSHGLKALPDVSFWAVRDTGTTSFLRAVTFGNDSFLALGSTNSLMSKDGISWSRYPFPLNGPYQFPPMGPEAVCYGNGRFVSVGVWEIRESPDGQTWRLWPQTLYLYHDI